MIVIKLPPSFDICRRYSFPCTVQILMPDIKIMNKNNTDENNTISFISPDGMLFDDA